MFDMPPEKGTASVRVHVTLLDIPFTEAKQLRMDLNRLRLLLELSRLGSMHDVAAELRTSTSSVSQGIAALAREVGPPLLEPDGRRVRLTPAGHRLAGHAVTILAAVDAARLDLDPASEPVG